MWSAEFDSGEGVVWVDVHVFGPGGSGADQWLRCIVDTGTPTTTIDIGIVDALGYGAHMARHRSRAVGIGGSESGYILPIARMDTMGMSSAVVAGKGDGADRTVGRRTA